MFTNTKGILRVDKKFRRFFIAFSLFVTNIVVGIVGFMIIEGYNFYDALYMTVITIGTVGFMEVHPLSFTGRMFTSFYILSNLFLFAFLASVITSYLVEGELKEIFSNYISHRKVKKLQNHVIVCGFGRNGHKACEQFKKNDIPFVVIEKNMDYLNENIDFFKDIPYIEGDATQDEVLKNAGVDRASALITTLPKDADSVFVTLSARQLNPNLTIIARANESSAESKLIRAGANKLVRPDLIGGVYMANLVTKPGVVEFLDMISGTGKLKLEEFEYMDFKEEFRGKSIIDLDIRHKTGASIMGFKDADKEFLINPHPDTQIHENDIMIVLGTIEQIYKFAEVYTDKKLTA